MKNCSSILAIFCDGAYRNFNITYFNKKLQGYRNRPPLGWKLYKLWHRGPASLDALLVDTDLMLRFTVMNSKSLTCTNTHT